MRTEPELLGAIEELKIGILDNNEWRRAIIALDFALEKTCMHHLTGKEMDLKKCKFCKRYWKENKK